MSITTNITTRGGGSVPTATVFGYLKPDINRPDIFEEKTVIAEEVHGPSLMDNQKNKSSQTTNPIIYAIGIIILSAVIFIVGVSWANCLQSYFDQQFVSPTISSETQSRFYFAITITLIGGIIICFLLLLWIYLVQKDKQC